MKSKIAENSLKIVPCPEGGMSAFNGRTGDDCYYYKYNKCHSQQDENANHPLAGVHSDVFYIVHEPIPFCPLIEGLLIAFHFFISFSYLLVRL